MLKLVAVLSTLAMFAAAPSLAEEAKLVRSISISGHGETRAVPDLAVISVGVTTQSLTAREALDGNTKAMTALMETLKGAGVEAKDMATSNFSVGPRYDYGNNNAQPPKVVGYDVNNMLTVTLRNIDTLGTVLDQAVSAGSNTINGITFSVSKPEAALDDARKAAVLDARRKAEIYASAGSFKLGDIISLTEGEAYQPPMQYMAKAARSESAGDVPIAQGEQSLSVDVNITYTIK
jgi:uncharacterized protein